MPSVAFSSMRTSTETRGSGARSRTLRRHILIVHFGPTQEHQFAGTHVKLDGPTIRTYNGFTSAREELRVWREDVLPSLLAGLATSFSTCEHAVKFLEAERAFYGVTSDSQTVLDFQDSGWASGYVSSRLSADEAVERVGSAMSIAAGIRPKVARFFHLGLNEDDPLKRFLIFLSGNRNRDSRHVLDNRSRSAHVGPRASARARSDNDSGVLQCSAGKMDKSQGSLCVVCSLRLVSSFGPGRSGLQAFEKDKRRYRSRVRVNSPGWRDRTGREVGHKAALACISRELTEHSE
jgi:hypothetical protein